MTNQCCQVPATNEPYKARDNERVDCEGGYLLLSNNTGEYARKLNSAHRLGRMSRDEEVQRFKDALNAALSHILELEEAWRTGAIRDTDGQGDTRSNRNIEVRNQIVESFTGRKE